MRYTLLIAAALLLQTTSAEAHKSAGSDRMKLCADQWKVRRAAHTAGVLSYRGFIRDCMKPAPPHASPAHP